jgi:competence protein ComEA
VVVGIGLAFVAWWWWQGRPQPVVQLPQSLSSEAPVAGAGSVVVHVVGAVRKPGIVTLPAGSRVMDAVQAAGGPKADEALASVNLARVLVDGEQIALGAAGSASAAPGKVSLNSASADELEALPGVGPVLAERMIQWRTTNGPFRSVDELGEVSGIGDAMLAQLRPLVQP